VSASAERLHMQRVKELPCSLCNAPAPSSAHHILEGRTPGRKSQNLLVIPLCFDCHQGKSGIHGDRSLWNVYRKTELQCLAETIERLFYD